MAEEEETKPGAILVSALQMAIQIQLHVDAVVVDVDNITLVCDTLMEHHSECSL